MSNIKIIPASAEHKKTALKLLDAFRAVCGQIVFSDPSFTSTTASDLGGGLYDKALSDNNSCILLAFADENAAGIVTAYTIPQIRKGTSIAEVEEFFVVPEYHGKGVAKELMKSLVEWAKEQQASSIRLETDASLKRAHNFYEKFGFEHYAKAYNMNL